MKTLRLPSVLLVAGGILFGFSGCSTPGAVKGGGNQVELRTPELGKAHLGDLAALGKRLDAAGKDLQLHRQSLAEARASQKLLAEQLAIGDVALETSQALTRFDQGAATLLSTEFDEKYHALYLKRLQPRLDELARARHTAEAALKADPQNIALLREREKKLALFLETRVQALEDYRLLHLEAAVRMQQVRQKFLVELEARVAAKRAAFPDLSKPRDYQTLFKPTKMEALPAAPDLLAGLAAREKEILEFTTSLNGLTKEVNYYLQTDGWRKVMLQSFFDKIIGSSSALTGVLLGKVETGTVEFLSKDLGLSNAAALVKPFFTEGQALADSFLKDAAKQIEAGIDTGIRNLEERILGKATTTN